MALIGKMGVTNERKRTQRTGDRGEVTQGAKAKRGISKSVIITVEVMYESNDYPTATSPGLPAMRSGRSTNCSPIEIKPGMARSILPGIESDD